MKNNYSLIFILLLGFVFSKAQNINIPDANFKQYLVSKFDTNGDGEIQQSEAMQATYISCSGKNISSLEGIQYFTNLKTLYCGNNQLISLNLQGLNSLETLGCWSNQLSLLNIAGLTNLKTIDSDNNLLPEVNLSGLNNLENIDFTYNQLTNLDLHGLPKLKIIDIGTNPLSSVNFKDCVNLEQITFFDTTLTTLDLSNLTNLLYVNCGNNLLSSINLSGCTSLKSLSINNNKLTSLNLQGLTNLQLLHCNYNQLTSLNLLSLTNLLTLECSNNNLDSLLIDNLNNLSSIWCDDNNLNSLSLKGLFNLAHLSLPNNKLTTLNIEDCKKLKEFDVTNNNLSTLFLKNGLKNEPYISGNPNLVYICCDQDEIEYLNYYVNQANLQNQCLLNSYCSFVPGGDYNTIKGNVKIDINNNGCDNEDLPFFPIKFTLFNNLNSEILIGNNDGSYKYFVNNGTYTITPIFENPDYFIASPQNHQFVFADSNNNTQTQDFCITSNGTKNDLEVKIIPETSVRPGFNTSFKLIYKNKGNTVLSGNVNFNFDSTKSQYISADVSPNSQTTGNLQWNYTNLKPFESRTVILTLKTNPPPIVNVNDELVYSSSINPTIEDLTADDNTFVLHQIVVGSFDPNDKICLEGSTISPEMIGKYITYKIRFENTGTANAEQVVIKDDINTSMFDVNSIIPITASHPYQTRITDNIVEFIFENINLPFDDEHNDGYIVFKIKSLPNLVVGSELKNKADIFFDYNLPITTNEFVTNFQTLNTQEVNSAIKINIYPNPVKHYLNIQTNDKIMSIEIFDLNGRILQNIISSETKINVSNLKKGIYIIKINTSKGSTTQKIIKD